MATLVEFSSAAESTETAGMVEIRATTLNPATTALRPAGSRGLRVAARRPFRPGFTLAELMVSVAVLLVLLTMVGWIFSTATRSSSLATAHNELMGNARTAERQISHDLEGLIRNSFIGIWYQLTPDPTDTNTPPTRFLRTDRMALFTASDHSSIQQTWDPVTHAVAPPGTPTANSTALRSNMARVFLGHYYPVNPAAPQPNRDPSTWVLARRSRLLMADAGQFYPSPVANDIEEDQNEFDPAPPPGYLFPFTPEDWRLLGKNYFPTLFHANGRLNELSLQSWMRRPRIDPAASPSYGMHMMFLPGCAEFKVQRWIERDPITGIPLGPSVMPRWYPEEDIDGSGVADPNPATNDFAAMQLPMAEPQIGNIREYFNCPNPASAPLPFASNHGFLAGPNSTQYYTDPGGGGRWLFYPEQDVPKAIKITIRLFDPNKRMADGQVITMTFPLPH